MTLMIRAHDGQRGMILSALTGLAILLLAGRVVALPQLLQGATQPVNVGLILALALAPVTAYVFGGESLRLESLARRSLLTADAALVSLIILPVLLAGTVTLITGDTDSGYGLIRNCSAFMAMTLALLTVTTPATAAGAPVAYFVVIATAGYRPGGHFPWWAWLRSPATPAGTALVLGMLTAAVIVYHRQARRRETAAPHDEV